MVDERTGKWKIIFSISRSYLYIFVQSPWCTTRGAWLQLPYPRAPLLSLQFLHSPSCREEPLPIEKVVHPGKKGLQSTPKNLKCVRKYLHLFQPWNPQKSPAKRTSSCLFRCDLGTWDQQLPKSRYKKVPENFDRSSGWSSLFPMEPVWNWGIYGILHFQPHTPISVCQKWLSPSMWLWSGIPSLTHSQMVL